MVHFMQAYNWTRIATIVSRKVPDYQSFLKELQKVQKEGESQGHDNQFEFTITRSVTITGMRISDIAQCNKQRQFCPFIRSTLRSLDKIYRNDDRIILFHGTELEMIFVLKAVKQHANGPKRHLQNLFGSNYLWMCTPTLTTPIQSNKRYQSINPDLHVILGQLKTSSVDYSVPGMFVFVVFNNLEAYVEKAKIALELWTRSLAKLTEILRHHHLNNDSVIANKLRPLHLCKMNDTKWIWGEILYQIMKATTLKIDDEYIGFLNNGAINTTEMYIYNSQIKDNKMGWHKVGSWSLSSKWGKDKSKLIIDGVTWPGNEIKPPKDRPTRFRLKVVTIIEVPFVIYRESALGFVVPEMSVSVVDFDVGSLMDVKESHRQLCYMLEAEEQRVGFEVSYPNERRILSAEEVYAIQLTKLKEVVEMNEGYKDRYKLYDEGDKRPGVRLMQECGKSKNAQCSGKCDANSIVCWTRVKSSQTKVKIDAEINFQLFGVNVTSDYPYISSCCSGLTMDMLSEFMKDLEFDVVLFDVPDGMWGGWTPNGWNGLVKTLLDGTADMSVTSFKITPNRSEQVDFSVPFQETGIAIIVALREGGISPKAFLEPYDYQSWCVILVFSVHACGAALFIYEWLSPKGLDRGNQADPKHKFSFFRSLWLIWSMLFGAAVNADNPRGTASRFLTNIWALFALVFMASYTANLAAFMIAKDDYYNLHGIKDDHLINPTVYKPPFSFATVPSGATEENIKINFPTMFEHMQKYNRSTVDDGIKALKSGDINAFIYDANVLEYRATKDENCKLRTVGNLFAMTGYGVAFPKESKWLNKINAKILEYQNNGKLQRWKRFWLTGACKKNRGLDSTNKRLGVRNFISAFILLLGGVILCTVLLFAEHLFYHYLRPRLTNIDRYGCCGLVSISIGQIISFEESLNRTVGWMKHYKCSNAICETQWWNFQHEINHLKCKIKGLENALLCERAENQFGFNRIEEKRRTLRISKNKIGVEDLKLVDSKRDQTPTYVYECTRMKENEISCKKTHLTCLNPSQIYKPNQHSSNVSSALLEVDQTVPAKLLPRDNELLEKESCL